MDCECLARCPFFNDLMTSMPSSTDLIKKTYCLKDWAHCARYVVFKHKGREAVPQDLFPTQMDRVGDLLL